MFDIIPAIDILEGSVVRLTQGDYSAIDTFETLPEVLALQFEREGASRIHLVDLNGAKEGSLVNLDCFIKIRQAVSCDLQVGGGIRTLETAHQLFDIGINTIILGSLLVKEPEIAEKIILKFPNKVIAGIDLKHGQLSIEGWREVSITPLDQLLKRLEKLPLAGIISTDIEKDGMMQGPGVESLTSLCKKTTLPIIASGGVSSLNDISTLQALHPLGISGCIVGKAILTEQIKLKDAIEIVSHTGNYSP